MVFVCLFVCLLLLILLVLVWGFGDKVSFNPRLVLIFLSPSVRFTEERDYENCAEALLTRRVSPREGRASVIGEFKSNGRM